jgi:glucose-1-phosphate thymidylyltransferase
LALFDGEAVARRFSLPARAGCRAGAGGAVPEESRTTGAQDRVGVHELMDKVVILAAGAGTRMQRRDTSAVLTETQASHAAEGVKAMMPIDRPFLDYVLSNVADAGYHRVCLVVGPGHAAMRDYYEQLSCDRLQFDYAIQEVPRGTADAVASAATFAGDDPFIVLNSDNHYPVDVLRALRDSQGPAVVGFTRQGLLSSGHIPADRIAKFSVVETDGDGNLRRIIEKPTASVVERLPEPILISMNCWRFGPVIFKACRSIDKSPRGEYEIPDAVMCSIRELGQPFRVIRSDAPVLDLSTRSDVASVASRLAGVEVHL